MTGKKRNKRFARKVTTGCITCRDRHVKCDELKPFCDRCIKFQVDCEGYGVRPVPRRPYAPRAASDDALLQNCRSNSVTGLKKLHKLAPNTIAIAKPAPPLSPWPPASAHIAAISLQLQPQPLPYPQTTAIIRQPPLMWINDERDSRYLRHFQEQTSSQLAGYFQDPVLRRGIFQACCLSPHITNAVIGLAALDRSSREIPGSPDAYKHYELATAKFIDSIRGMRQSMESLEPLRDPRLFLIFCLLTFCFEAWNGSSHSAVSQVRSGWHHARRWLDARSSRPDVMDCGLILLFNRLDNSTIVSLGTKREVNNEFLPSRWMVGIDDEMPPVFETVEDARMWHEMLVRSMLQRVLESHKIKLASTRLSKTQGTYPASPETHHINYLANARQSLVAKFEQWYKAFVPLLKPSPDSSAYAATIALELRYRASSKPLAGTLGLGEGCFDAYNADFASAIQLASTLIAHEKSHYPESGGIARFTIDGSIVPSLYVVSIKCRDRCVRRQAVQLLLENPRREGLWDSGLTARIGILSISIEEDGALGDGSIPEYARIVGVRAFSSMLERSGTMNYTKTMIDVDMKPVMVEQSLEFCW